MLLTLLNFLLKCRLIPLSAVLLVTQRNNISGTNRETSPRQVDKILNTLVAEGTLSKVPSINSGYRVSGNGVVTLFPDEQGTQLIQGNIHIRVPVNQVGYYRLNRAHEALISLHDILPADLSRLIPLSRRYETDKALPIFVETLLPGKSCVRFNKVLIMQLLKWIAHIHSNTLKIVYSPNDHSWQTFGQKRITTIIKTIEATLAWYGDIHHHRCWSVIKPILLTPPISEGMVLCRTHGDLQPRNVLHDPQQNIITGVIDWETSFDDWIPCRDLYHVLMGLFQPSGGLMPDGYRHVILESSKASQFIENYCQLVPDEIRRNITHPWSKIIFPLERLQTIFDDYDLFGVVTKEGWGRDLLYVLEILADYIRSNSFKA